jgi:hypothetical protein
MSAIALLGECSCDAELRCSCAKQLRTLFQYQFHCLAGISAEQVSALLEHHPLHTDTPNSMIVLPFKGGWWRHELPFVINPQEHPLLETFTDHIQTPNVPYRITEYAFSESAHTREFNSTFRPITLCEALHFCAKFRLIVQRHRLRVLGSTNKNGESPSLWYTENFELRIGLPSARLNQPDLPELTLLIEIGSERILK